MSEPSNADLALLAVKQMGVVIEQHAKLNAVAIGLLAAQLEGAKVLPDGAAAEWLDQVARLVPAIETVPGTLGGTLAAMRAVLSVPIDTVMTSSD